MGLEDRVLLKPIYERLRDEDFKFPQEILALEYGTKNCNPDNIHYLLVDRDPYKLNNSSKALLQICIHLKMTSVGNLSKEEHFTTLNGIIASMTKVENPPRAIERVANIALKCHKRGLIPTPPTNTCFCEFKPESESDSEFESGCDCMEDHADIIAVTDNLHKAIDQNNTKDIARYFNDLRSKILSYLTSFTDNDNLINTLPNACEHTHYQFIFNLYQFKTHYLLLLDGYESAIQAMYCLVTQKNKVDEFDENTLKKLIQMLEIIQCSDRDIQCEIHKRLANLMAD